MERNPIPHHASGNEYGICAFPDGEPVRWAVPNLTFHGPPVRFRDLGEVTAYGIREYPWPLDAEDAARLRSETWWAQPARVIDDYGVKASTVGLVEVQRHAYALHIVLRPAVREPLLCRLALPNSGLAAVSTMTAIATGGADSYCVGREWRVVGTDTAEAEALYVAPTLRLLQQLRLSFHGTITRDAAGDQPQRGAGSERGGEQPTC